MMQFYFGRQREDELEDSRKREYTTTKLEGKLKELMTPNWLGPSISSYKFFHI